MSSRKKRRNRRPNRSKSTANQQHPDRSGGTDETSSVEVVRSSTETKPSFRTTELALYAVAVLAVVMTSLAIDDDGQGGTDPFGADRALRYITYLTVGYMLARGLAKAGSYEHRGRRDATLGARDTDVVDDTDAADHTDGDVVDADFDDTATDTGRTHVAGGSHAMVVGHTAEIRHAVPDDVVTEAELTTVDVAPVRQPDTTTGTGTADPRP